MSVLLFQLLFVLRTATVIDSFEISRYQPRILNFDTRPDHPRPANGSPSYRQISGGGQVGTDIVLQLILRRLRQHSSPSVKSAISSRPSLTDSPNGLVQPARTASDPPDKYLIPPRLVHVKPTPSLPPVPFSLTTPVPVSDPVNRIYPQMYNVPMSTDEEDADFDVALSSLSRPIEPCSESESKHYCLNGGDCIWITILEEKSCKCPVGYSGKRCESTDHSSLSDDYYEDDEEEDYFLKRSHRSSVRRRFLKPVIRGGSR